MLTAHDRAAYARDGFVAVPRFLDVREVELLREELAHLMARGRLRNVATAGDGITPSTTAMNLQICPVSPVSPVFRALPFADQVIEAVGGLLGTDFYLRLDQIFLKPGRHGAGTNWHQDNAYFRDGADHLADRGVGLWIALHPATIANGTMQVIPRRCLTTLAHRRDGGSDHHITCADRIDPADAVPIELPAGGVLFFNWGVPHCTTGNLTEHERGALALHFQDLAYRPVGINLGDRPCPVLRGPGADGGRETYGEDQRGRWAALLAARAGVGSTAAGR